METLPEQFQETHSEPADGSIPQVEQTPEMPGTHKRIKGPEVQAKLDRVDQPTEPLKLVPAEEPVRLSWPRRIWNALGRAEVAVTSYILINFTSAIAFFLYRVFNRTKVYGRWNPGISRNTLILSNHRTMIDSYLLGHLTSWPTGFILPHVLPCHPAAKENFFRNRIIGWFSKRWRCIPVRRGVRDFAALSEMADAVRKWQMIIFPEGTRSRNGELLPGRPGTGKLIKDTRCKCVPVYVKGMNNLLPVGKAWPRLFKRVAVNFGKPIDMSDLFDLPDGKEASQKIIDRVMEHIAAVRDELETLEANRLPWYKTLARAVQRVFLLPVHLVRRLMAIVR